MNPYPKISIITPSFNQGQFLEETIQSVLDQNYPNLEYIIIDGGSTDNSVEIIKKYEQQLSYWVSEPDRGHGHALNKGFARATGEIMAWINSDDKYLPWTFETVAEVFTVLPEVEWIQGNPATWDEKGRLVTSRTGQKNLIDFLIGNYAWIQQESTFGRRSLWERSGGYIDEHYQYMIDGELWSRFFLSAELFRADRIIGGFRHHDSNRSRENLSLCRAEMETIVHKFRKDFDWKRFPRSVFWAINFFYFLYRFSILTRLICKVVFKLNNNYFKNDSIAYKYIFWGRDSLTIKKNPYTIFS